MADICAAVINDKSLILSPLSLWSISNYALYYFILSVSVETICYKRLTVYSSAGIPACFSFKHGMPKYSFSV